MSRIEDHLQAADEHLAAADALAAHGRHTDTLPRLLAALSHATLAAAKIQHARTERDANACPVCDGSADDHEPNCPHTERTP